MSAIKDLIRTCTACPSQWEGHVDDGRMIYIRYRHGHFYMKVSESPTDNVMDCLDNPHTVIDLSFGNMYDGFMTDVELIELLIKEKIILPDFKRRILIKFLSIYEKSRIKVTRFIPVHKIFSDSFCWQHFYFWYLRLFDRKPI